MEQVGRVPGKKTTKELAARQCVFRVTQPKPSSDGRDGAPTGATNAASQSRSGAGSFHARRSHRKSHLGCQNCKKRRIKCDETQPSCQKCERHGLVCIYGSQASKPVPVSSGSPRRDGSGPASDDATVVRGTPWRSTGTVSKSLPVAGSYIDDLLGSGSPLGNSLSVQMLHHFTNHAYSTIGEGLAQQVTRRSVPSLASSNPLLMHAILGFAALHLQHLLPAEQAPAQRSQYALVSSYHWSRVLSLFQSVLSGRKGDMQASMDVIVSTCLLLNMRSMSMVDEAAAATTTTSASPDSWGGRGMSNAVSSGLSTSFVYSATTRQAHQALSWLYMQSGSMALIMTFGKHLPSSIWSPVFVASDEEPATFSDHRAGRVGLPGQLADLFDIRDGDTAETNSYHQPLRLMVPLLRVHAGLYEALPVSSSAALSSPGDSSRSSCSSSSGDCAPFLGRPPSMTDFFFTKAITWPSRIRPDFRVLLAERDPRALLLMGCWFAIAVDHDTWWLHDRARREGAAICEFLGRPFPPPVEASSRLVVMRSLLGWIRRQVGYFAPEQAVAAGDEAMPEESRDASPLEPAMDLLRRLLQDDAG